MKNEKNIGHFNITGFRAAVTALKNEALRGRPFVIAGRTGGQDIAADISPAAAMEGIKKGMALAQAQRLVKDLIVAAPDPAHFLEANKVLDKVISRYAPVWQNDGAGNIYFDITGTRRLFGSAPDCVCRIQNEILEKIKIDAAAATGTNKLVCKVASRTIRPEGLIEVSPGDEAAFLSHQDITLLPGLGPSLMKTIRVTGFYEIGELAALSDNEALSLFGKKGPVLRDSARGIDNSSVAPGKRTFESRADFCEDVTDEMIIRGSITSLAEHSGLEMRKEKSGATEICLNVFYSDGVKAEGREKLRRLCILDRDIALAAEKIYKKTVVRRIRIRTVSLSLEGLVPLDFQPDLFEPFVCAESGRSNECCPLETEIKNRKLQEAADKIKNRYGTGKVTRGIVLAAAFAGKKPNNILCIQDLG